MTNIFGPHGPGINESTTRPAATASGNPLDTWFTPCVGGDPNTGTKVPSVWLNFMTANMRQAIRGMGVPENETDDELLLKAIQAAGVGASFGFFGIRVFTVTGPYVPTSGARRALAILIGGGGGGEGAGGGKCAVGGGGAAGAMVWKFVDLVGVTSIPVVIGAGGAGGLPGIAAASGQTGGATELGSLARASGGGGATTHSNSGVTISPAGVGSSAGAVGELIVPGQSGEAGAPDVYEWPGNGGSSMFGSGGLGGFTPGPSGSFVFGGNGQPGQGYGGGGGGGGATVSFSGSGGAGAPGICVILEFA